MYDVRCKMYDLCTMDINRESARKRFLFLCTLYIVHSYIVPSYITSRGCLVRCTFDRCGGCRVDRR